MRVEVASTRGRLLSASALVAGGSLVSLALGYGREVLIAHQYGAGHTTDAFFIAFFTPQIVYQILITGPVVWALTPLLMRVEVDEGVEARDRLAGRALSAIGIVLTVLAGVWVIFARPFADIAAPFANNDEQHLAAQLTQIMAPQVLTYGMGALLVAVLYARGHVFIPVVAQIVNNALVVAIALFLGPGFGVRGVAIAVVVSSVAFLLVVFAGTALTGRPIVPGAPRLGAYRRELTFAVLPLVAISVLAQAPGVFERALATLLPGGDLTSISYGYRLLQLAQAAVAAVASVAFVGLSSSAARQRGGLFNAQLGWTVRFNLQFAILAAGCLASLAPLIVRIAYGGGALTGASEGLVVATTQLAVVALPLIGISVALQQSLYATSRWRLLGVVTGAGVLVHLIGASLLIPLAGARGFVVANLAAQLALCVACVAFVARRATLDSRALAIAGARTVAAALAGSAALWVVGAASWTSLPRAEAAGAVLLGAALYGVTALGVLALGGDSVVRGLARAFVAQARVLFRESLGPAVILTVSVAAGIAVCFDPLLLLLPIVFALMFLAVTRSGFALVALVLYLPLDWIVVLVLDSHGHPEGRLIRVLLIGALAAAWLIERQAGRPLPLPFSVLVLIGAVVVLSLVELLNPGVPDLSTGAIGVETRLLPIALLYVGAELLPNRRILMRMSAAVLAVLLITGVVIVAQVVRGDTLVPALGLNYPLFGVGVGSLSVDRFPGPFLGAGLGQFLMIAFAIGVATFHLGRKRWRLLWTVGAAAWLVALFANNQRSLFVFLALDAPLVLILGHYGRRLLAVPIWLLVLVVPAFWLAGNAFVARTSTLTTDPGTVIIGKHLELPFQSRVLPAIDKYPLGNGLGTESPGTRFLTDSPTVQTTPESFVASIVGELGIPGLFLYASLLGTSAVLLLRGAISATDTVTRRLNATMLVVTLWVLQLAIAYEPLSYFPFAPFYWLLVGGALGLGRTRSPVPVRGESAVGPRLAFPQL